MTEEDDIPAGEPRFQTYQFDPSLKTNATRSVSNLSPEAVQAFFRDNGLRALLSERLAPLAKHLKNG